MEKITKLCAVYILNDSTNRMEFSHCEEYISTLSETFGSETYHFVAQGGVK